LVDFRNPDFAAHARACGANGYSVSDEDELEAAFKDRSLPASVRHRREDHTRRSTF